MTAKPTNYLSNKYLLEQLELSHAQDELTPELVAAFQLLATRVSYHRYFAHYSWREDLPGTAMVFILKHWRKFDKSASENPNPFAYFTTLCMNSNHGVRKTEHKQRTIVDAMKIDAGRNPSANGSSMYLNSDEHAFAGSYSHSEYE